MRLFEVNKVSYYAPNKGYSVKLVEVNGHITFSVLVGGNEVQSIALALEGITPPRPTPHDVIIDVLNSVDVKLKKIEIYKILHGNLISRFHIKNIHIGEKYIDCKPSDAIAIAIRYCCPIHVSTFVLKNLKIIENSSNSEFYSIEKYKKKDTPEEIINKLNFALEEAITNENFEVAAKLRDKIISLEKSSS
mgnify:CR=1 FL=1